MSTDPPFVFLSRSHSAVRAQMTQGILRGEGLIVLTGEPGTGKTTISRLFIQSLPKPVFVSAAASPLLGYEALLQQMLADFEVPARHMAAADDAARSGWHDLVLILNRFLAAMPPDARAILILDDAHKIRPDLLAQLRELTNLRTPAGKLLQVILIGRPALQSLFDLPEARPLRERVARWCTLEPLTDTEVDEYTRDRLASASQTAGRLEPVMSAEAVRLAARLSQGIPARLDPLCDRAAEVALERQVDQIGRREVIASARRQDVTVPLSLRLVFRPLVLTLALATIIAIAVGLWMIRRSTVAAPAAAARGGPSSSGQAPPVEKPAPRPPEGAPAPITPAASAAPSPDIEGGTPAVRDPIVADRLPAAESLWVVVASFKNLQGANDTVKALTDRDLPALWRKDGSWHVVMVGPYQTQDDAREVLMKVTSREFKDSHIVKQAVPETSTR